MLLLPETPHATVRGEPRSGGTLMIYQQQMSAPTVLAVVIAMMNMACREEPGPVASPVALPPVVQATVDGASWIAEETVLARHDATDIRIVARGADGREIRLRLMNTGSNGTFPMTAPGLGSSATIAISDPATKKQSALYQTGTDAGTVEIHLWNSDRIEGTFRFIAYADVAGSYIIVNNGYFRLPLNR